MTQTVVYKIGGSLLSLPDLAARIRAVLQQQSGTQPLLVAGGGRTADLVRDWDEIHQLGDETAHWLALRSLTLNQALLLELLPNARIVTDRAAAADAWTAGHLPIICAHSFLRAEEHRLREEEPGACLPHNWDVSSDSVAAWIALNWPASELVLLKSTDMPNGCNIETAATDGFVDGYFPILGRRVNRISWVNARRMPPTMAKRIRAN